MQRRHGLQLSLPGSRRAVPARSPPPPEPSPLVFAPAPSRPALGWRGTYTRDRGAKRRCLRRASSGINDGQSSSSSVGGGAAPQLAKRAWKRSGDYVQLSLRASSQKRRANGTLGHVADTESVAISVRWQSIDDLPVTPANQFAVQLGIPDASGKPDGVYLTLGLVTPPFFNATSIEEVNAQVEAMTEGVQIVAHHRYLVSRSRLQELIDLLTAAGKAYDDAGGTS